MCNNHSKLLAKLSRKIRKRRQHGQLRKHRQQHIELQQLEPRVLLSATEPIMYYSSAPVRVVDAGTNQIQERVREVSSAWFEDLMPDIAANADTGVSSINWKGTSVTTISDQWIVQLSDQGLAYAQSVGDTADLLNLDQYNGQVVRGLGMAGLVLIQTQLSMDHDQFMDTLLASGFVDYIQPNAVLQNQAITPNDSSFANQWALNNTGQFNGSVVDADMDLPEAWQISTGNHDVVIGVIDTGVRWNHPDLAVNMWHNPGEINNNGIDDDGNGFVDDYYGYDFVNNDGNPMDDHGHGTHVAGIIAARGDNGVGVAGVSWANEIMALKFMGVDGTGSTSDAVRAINYATMMKTQYGVNVQVTCNSWGSDAYSASLYNAIVTNKDAGMLFVAAAGNDATNNDATPQYPANYDVDNIISVASTDWSDQLSSFSNFGNTVDIAAPGTYIYSTTYNGSYGYMSGTSMAAPQVAGLAALAWSVKPDATWQEIKSAILDNGDTLASLNGKVNTSSRVNAYNTIMAVFNENTAPNIAVVVGATEIAHNQTQPVDFGTGDTSWASMQDYMDVQFIINNDGYDDLLITSITADGGFQIVQNVTDNSLVHNQSTEFTVRLPTNTQGTFTGSITITTNDPDTPQFKFNVTGVVTAPPPAQGTPRFTGLNGPNYRTINKGMSYEFASCKVGDVVDYTFMLQNTGDGTLNVSEFLVDGTGFTIVESLSSTIGALGYDTFTLRVDTNTVGMKNATVTIRSNVVSNPTFTFNITTPVQDVNNTPLPADLAVYYGSKQITNGQAQVVDMGTKTQGTISNISFKILNKGQADMYINQLTLPAGFKLTESLSQNYRLPGGFTHTVNITVPTDKVGTFGGTITLGTNDTDEPTFTFDFTVEVEGAHVPAPEIEVLAPFHSYFQNGKTIYDMGTAQYGNPNPERIIKVWNRGDKNLTISSLSIGSGYMIVEGLDKTIAPDQADTFTVRMLTNTVGERQATVTIVSNDADEKTFKFDVYGVITTPPNAFDFSVAWAEANPDYFTPGKKSKVLVDVTNNGMISFSGEVTIHVYANTSSTLDGNEILLGQTTSKLSIKQDQTKTNRITIELDSDIPADDYYLFAVVDPDNAITENDEENNIMVTTMTSQVAWKFGDLGDGKKTLLKLTDDDGTEASFILNGKGIGQIVENSDGTWNLFVTGTNSSTKIAITCKGGDGKLILRDLVIGNPDDENDLTDINQLACKDIDLQDGQFIITGSAKDIILGDLIDTQMIFNGSNKQGTNITLNQLTDVTINSNTGFNKFNIVDWADTNATEDVIVGKWINNLSVKGSKKTNKIGDLAANLILDGIGAKGYTLNTVTINGQLSQRTWDITGNIKLMKIDSVEDTDINVAGRIEKALFGHMLDGSLTAQYIDTLTTSIAKNVIGSTGNFTADLKLTGSKSTKYSLKSASIKGDIEDCDWDLTGQIGAMVVKGNVDGLVMNVVDDVDNRLNAQIEKLILNTVDDADITVQGTINFAKANTWASGSITAEDILSSKLPKS